jgi:superfamily II DNA helicase RecQ
VLDAAGEAAFERLRAWRGGVAKAIAKPAYVVFSDETLRLLAAAMPADEAGLRRIKGIGPTKLDAYGDDLLAVLDEVRAAP